MSTVDHEIANTSEFKAAEKARLALEAKTAQLTAARAERERIVGIHQHLAADLEDLRGRRSRGEREIQSVERQKHAKQLEAETAFGLLTVRTGLAADRIREAIELASIAAGLREVLEALDVQIEEKAKELAAYAKQHGIAQEPTHA
ncbi:MAG: hypothetical protein KIT22_18980 [Verrucomicrobiae bacterium]|nr:hypothetical protein [Verrucomicrobiae bacterium]